MDGYQALGKALTEMTPEQVIEEIKRSGLRGRGGAGFPTGRKWELAAMYHADQKYVACNADEGDPVSYTHLLPPAGNGCQWRSQRRQGETHPAAGQNDCTAIFKEI